MRVIGDWCEYQIRMLAHLTVNLVALPEVNTPSPPTVTKTSPQKNPSPMVASCRCTSLQRLTSSWASTATTPTPTWPRDSWCTGCWLNLAGISL